jgi:hypothetical protein
MPGPCTSPSDTPPSGAPSSGASPSDTPPSGARPVRSLSQANLRLAPHTRPMLAAAHAPACVRPQPVRPLGPAPLGLVPHTCPTPAATCAPCSVPITVAGAPAARSISIPLSISSDLQGPYRSLHLELSIFMNSDVCQTYLQD